MKFLDPSLKVLTGTWTPPAPQTMTKQQQKDAAKADKEAQKKEEAAEKQRVAARCYQLSRTPIGQLSEDQLRTLDSCRYLDLIH